jgi:hypothetical protein
MLILVASAASLEGMSSRSVAQATISAGHGTPCAVLIEAALLPGAAILAPPSDTRAAVGTRIGSAIALDLSHLAGSPLELERRRADLPPPAAT